MLMFEGDELLEQVQNIIHEGTQKHELSIDLTVDEIHKFTKSGALDFGGSEFEPAGTETITPEKQNTEDDYGWWNLKGGMYKAVFNEQLQHNKDTVAFISPHEHASKAGLNISSNTISGETDTDGLEIIFQVPEAGCRIKENARIATLHILAE